MTETATKVVIPRRSPMASGRTPLTGVVAPTGNTQLTVSYNSTDLPEGTYYATLKVYSNDPIDPTLDIPITLDVTGGVTGVDVVGMPDRLALGKAFPNPFGPSTSIRFDVPAGGVEVDLSIYDVTGRRVRSLLSGTQPGGRHLVVWDGKDSSGRRVASGAYFYRLRAGDFEATRKIVTVQ